MKRKIGLHSAIMNCTLVRLMSRDLSHVEISKKLSANSPKIAAKY
jgi:hypothetical protein